MNKETTAAGPKSSLNEVQYSSILPSSQHSSQIYQGKSNQISTPMSRLTGDRLITTPNSNTVNSQSNQQQNQQHSQQHQIGVLGSNTSTGRLFPLTIEQQQQITGGSSSENTSTTEQDRKRIKLEVGDVANNEDLSALKRRILEHKYMRLRSVKEKYSEHVAELFFLQSNLNMMDYPAWRKKPQAPEFMNFVRLHRLDQSQLDDLAVSFVESFISCLLLLIQSFIIDNFQCFKFSCKSYGIRQNICIRMLFYYCSNFLEQTKYLI